MNVIDSIQYFELPALEEYDIVLGIDEAGRGALAGPVSISCISFNKQFFLNIRNPELLDWVFDVKDSKQLLPEKREQLFKKIINYSNYYKNLLISAKLIDKIGINESIKKSIIIFLKDLILYKNKQFNPDIKNIKIFMDGNYKFNFDILKIEFSKLFNVSFTINSDEYHIEFCGENSRIIANIQNIIKGDSKVFSIACSSIVSKYIRDQYMIKISRLFPQYGFENHKGYGTRNHYEKINQYGLSILHRKSYNISNPYN